MTLADRLRHAMFVRGMTQKQLADAVGVKPPSVNGWLSAKAKFLRGENLLKAAAALGVDQDWLATGVGQMELASGSATSSPAQPSQPGRPDPETLRRAMRLLSFVSQMQAAPIDFSEDADALLAAYDLVSQRPSSYSLEDASKRMVEFLQARRSDGRVDGRNVVGAGRKAVGKD